MIAAVLVVALDAVRETYVVVSAGCTICLRVLLVTDFTASAGELPGAPTRA